MQRRCDLLVRLLLVVATTTPIVSAACTCFFPQLSEAEATRWEYKRSTAVFSARVVRTFQGKTAYGYESSFATLLLLDVWKGPHGVTDEITVEIFHEGANCAYRAREKDELLVFLSGTVPRLEDCSLTGKLENSKGAIEALNRLRKQSLKKRRLTIRSTAHGPGSNLAGMVEQALEINCLRQPLSMGPARSAGR